jgi:hypothetical protein
VIGSDPKSGGDEVHRFKKREGPQDNIADLLWLSAIRKGTGVLVLDYQRVRTIVGCFTN